ncbi:hypothetical protein KSP39_PZI019757 [Platanthera zijinensis]|uniref:Late embryogenesis abundant protein LEA-2 subgroup domain-containing protein n=1 Tax=Platanthera zijinensis TaxID=2320716 RepID=A0AAP0B1M8_9ASPA
MVKPELDAVDPLLPLPPPPPPSFSSPSSAPSRQETNPPPNLLLLLPTFITEHRLRPPSGCIRCSPVLSSSFLTAAAVFSLVGVALFLLWPSHPNLHLDRLSIEHVRVSFHPSVTVSIYLRLRIRIRNPDFFSLDYDFLNVAIGYRGEQLGSILSAGERVRARGVSYVDAELQLDGIEVLHNVFYLIDDLAKGSMTFDTVTGITGVLHFVFFDIPIKASKFPSPSLTSCLFY